MQTRRPTSASSGRLAPHAGAATLADIVERDWRCLFSSRASEDPQMRRSNKPRISKLGVIVSVIVALTHIAVCVYIGPRTNKIFQEWFDTGIGPSGDDATIAHLGRVLSLPLPAVLLAEHPSRPLGFPWWSATIMNGILWGLAAYACIALALRGARWLSGVRSLRAL
jgi:hypothetical protein